MKKGILLHFLLNITYWFLSIQEVQIPTQQRELGKSNQCEQYIFVCNNTEFH